MNYLYCLILMLLTCTVWGNDFDGVQVLRKKNFAEDWINGLAARGVPETYTGDDLDRIGMPAGGLFCGQVYLAGDGTLWYWDIHNTKTIDPGGPGDKFYRNPMVSKDYQRLETGFALEITGEQTEKQVRTFNRDGFRNVTFRGSYPVGQVGYHDPDCPLAVELQAFSPFCPLNTDDSSLPATCMIYKVKNTSRHAVKFRIGGWLQNSAAYFKGQPSQGKHRNRDGTASANGYARLICEAVDPSGNTTLQELNSLPDFGSMTLSLLNRKGKAATRLGNNNIVKSLFKSLPDMSGRTDRAAVPIKECLLGGVVSDSIELASGREKEIRFLLTWHFANIHKGYSSHRALRNHNYHRHYYSKKFSSAKEVADYVNKNQDRLINMTRLWRDTWYDSTLPYWFLDRTFLNISTLATTVFHRFHDTKNKKWDGRPYCREGVSLGDGTCTHVLGYEQAIGRLFPEVARDMRRIVDYDIAWDDKVGFVRYRAEYNAGRHPGIPHAVDGHCTVVLRTWREHTLSKDNSFLEPIWHRVKRSIQFMIDQDRAGKKWGKATNWKAGDKSTEPDGILEGPQYNTLDRSWYGRITWISGLYNAALRAGAEMAKAMGDKDFADLCRAIADRGKENISRELFNRNFGYFVHELDPDHSSTPQSNNGCHVDQVYGQSWAVLTGLDRVLPKQETQMALRKILQHNFYRDCGDYLSSTPVPPKRFYCDPGEPGLFMCTFPHGGAEGASVGKGWDALASGYFSEVWTAQEYHVAALTIAEGMVIEGLALVKAVHDRYHPSKRNPYNEIEYGNHYSRAMAGYGPFIAITGFEFNGPEGCLSFSPELQPNNFRSAFTASEGWGTIAQQRDPTKQTNTVEVKYGKLRLKRLVFKVNDAESISSVAVKVDNRINEVSYQIQGGNLEIDSKNWMIIESGRQLEIITSYAD